MAIATYQDLCIDAVDAHAMGRFWAAVLGHVGVALQSISNAAAAPVARRGAVGGVRGRSR